jgi:uncharacterized membrane protein
MSEKGLKPDISICRTLHMTILVTLHVLAVVVWVGGRFFSLWCCGADYALASHLPPFIPMDVVLLLFSGCGILFLSFGGFAGTRLHIHVMQARASDDALFLLLFFAP